jgi:hypothetical protein
MSFSEVFEELERQLNAMYFDFRRMPDDLGEIRWAEPIMAKIGERWPANP